MIYFSYFVKFTTVPKITAYESNEDPPSLTKGRGIPVGINKPIEVEILIKA